MIRVPETQQPTPDVAGVFSDAAPQKLGQGPDHGLVPPPPAVSQVTDTPPSQEEVERLARVERAAGIVRDKNGTFRNQADLDDQDISFVPSDAKIATKQASITLKRQSIAHLQQLVAQPDERVEGEDPAVLQASLTKQQEAQLSDLAQSVLTTGEQVDDDEARAMIESHGEAVIADHDAAAVKAADKARQQKARQLAAQAVDTSIAYAATFVDEPEARARELFELEQEIEEQGALEGWSAEQTAQKVTDAHGAVHTQIVDRLIADDPARARRWLTGAQADLLPALQRAGLDHKITIATYADQTAQLVAEFLSLDEALPTEQEFKERLSNDTDTSALAPETRGAVEAVMAGQYTQLVRARHEQEKQRFSDVSDQVQQGQFDPVTINKLKDDQKVDLVLLRHENEVAARQARARSTDSDVFGLLFGQGLTKFADADLVSYRSRVSEDDYQTLHGLQQQLATAKPRDRKLAGQYFANLADLAAKADRHTVRMEILGAGLAEFAEENSVPKFARQIEILDEVAKAYRLQPVGQDSGGNVILTKDDLPMPGDSPEEAARKQAVLEARRIALERQTQPGLYVRSYDLSGDGSRDGITRDDVADAAQEFGIGGLAATFGISEKKLRYLLEVDHQRARAIFSFLGGEEGEGGDRFYSKRVVAFTTLVGEKLGRDFIEGLKTNYAAVGDFGRLVDLVHSGPLSWSDHASKEVLEKAQSRLITELVMQDMFVDALDKIGKYGGRSLALLNMAQAFHSIVQSGFETETIVDEAGAAAGGAIGASIGSLFGAVCGPAALICAVGFSAVGGAVGSYVGENARDWIGDVSEAISG
ncbi:MAG: hypothetical protein ABF335_11205 [Alphaproteobacteria bacterium]